MSLTVDGVWKTGVFATTLFAAGVWREGAYSALIVPGLEYTMPPNRVHYTMQLGRIHYTMGKD